MEYVDLGLLILRIGLGIIFIAHGWMKLRNPSAWAKNMGLPTFVGLLVSIGEFFGGLGILFGFLTQIAALGPLLVMLGALRYHIFVWKQKFINIGGESWEYPFVLAVAALSLALLGAGGYSLDNYFNTA
jgi:putative oxidoreductase